MSRFSVKELLIAVLVGVIGFLLNMLELQLGWGLHFIFGNALVFACVRVLSPKAVGLAGAISSARSIFLWNHPWAWLIWTIEASFVALTARRASPVRSDVIFWVLIGTPLLLLSYGVIMDIDRLSLMLVVAKQATNGILNVVLGEIIYVTFISLWRGKGPAEWPKMPIDAFIMMILMAVILVPTTVYLALDAPSREQTARNEADRTLQERLQVAGAALGLWGQARSDMLRFYAEQHYLTERVSAAGPVPAVPAELMQDFQGLQAFSANGATLWATSGPGGQQKLLLTDEIRQAAEARLVILPQTGQSQKPDLALVVPFRENGQRAVIVAPLRDETLVRITSSAVQQDIDSLFLVHPQTGFLPLSEKDPTVTSKVTSLPGVVQYTALNTAVLVSQKGYGSALMSDLRDARMVRASLIEQLPQWKVIGVLALAPEVLKAREGQLQLFYALCIFVVLVTLFTSLLSKRTEHSLRELAQSAADLAMLGTKRDKIDSLVIRELSDISGTIATVGSTVSRERGALASYQRRLNSIACHAPVVVYALDVVNERKGELLYVSDALEKILGYTRADLAKPGWWSHAVHPEDYHHCARVFSELRPGKVITAEYRLRHKQGHYVWVYDTLSIEGGSGSDVEAVGLILDISERKSAAEQLVQADKMASLGRMVSGVAHELNQPLNFIKMASTNLREYAQLGRFPQDKFVGKLDAILSHVARASAIILQMRVFGRPPKEAPYPMPVKDAVDAVLTMLAPQIEVEGTRIDTSKCRPDIQVRALPVLLEQVLLNLMLNANDAIRTRQKTGNKTAGTILLAIEQQDEHAVISVEDNGIGLSAEVAPSLFEPFFTTKPPKEGTGLGLSISYGIIRDLGGTIHGENTGNGARFVIELPLADKVPALA